MTPEIHAGAELLFYEALDLPAPERAAFLDDSCGVDVDLRGEIDELLRAYDTAPGFLHVDAPASSELESEFARLKPEEVGERIGNYKLLEQIGEGGFGVVWVAEQEKPMRRRVALKIIKLGMDTKAVIARFEQERQALAMMDHPNIAKVHEAGTTPFGRPYFVMELVRGIKITEYCDQANLPTHERLRLFITVCQAVQHAHQKGIIHRDLKPSNILVTLHDGVPVPKVIDFGVAKATQQQRLTDLTVYTQFEQMIGTPLYMSPEQAEMSGLDIDTRSDIYSLGVLLYELLVGRTPFDPEALMKKGLDEIRRAVREQEPQKPSTFVSTMALDLRTNLAQHRQTESAKLIGQIRGDLDWIVMKALEKDRTRRYETANGLAKDIERHLLSEPVQARRPTQLYRFRRFAKRNKVVFGASAGIAAALIGGSAISVWQALRANAALSELRASAPAFAEQAGNLAARERFDEAIEKLNTSIELRPDVAEYSLAKADILRSQFRFQDAASAYSDALRVNPTEERARGNAELCGEFASEIKLHSKLFRPSLLRLYLTMQRERRPAAEVLQVARYLGKENDLLLAYWTERLQEMPISGNRPLKDRLKLDDLGRLRLDLSGSDVSDLTPLRGMPLDNLILSGCGQVASLAPLSGMPLRGLELGPLTDESLGLSRDACAVSDLSPLRGMPLEVLNVSRTRVFDLDPLRGMPLKELALNYTGVNNLRPLTGMPLRRLDCTAIPVSDFSILETLPLQNLNLAGTPIDSLSFLRGSRLESLSLEGCIKAYHYEVLAQIPALESLILPAEYPDLPENELLGIELLRNHAVLRRISYNKGPRADGIPLTKADFWRDFDRERRYQAVLMQICGGERNRFRRREGTWYVNLEGTPVTDISALAGMPISILLLSGTRISDLAPVRGMPLQVLYCAGTQISDLEPLRNLPLERVYLDNCPPGLDLEPLANAKKLYSLLLPPDPRNLQKLKDLPNLKYLSYEADKGDYNRFEQTAEEFWKGQQPITAESLARKGEFAGAEKLLRQKVKTSRAVEHWEALSAVILAQGAYDRYEVLANEMIQNFGGDTVNELSTARVCLFSPVQYVPLAKMKPLMRRIQLLEVDSRYSGWYLNSKAMLELRDGNPSGALVFLSRMGPERQYCERATANVISAMAHARLGQHEAAAAVLGSARRQILACWPAPSQRQTYWHEWLIAHLLFNKAEQLVNSPGESVGDSEKAVSVKP